MKIDRDNAMIASFSGTFRDECLNVHGFLSMEDAGEKINNRRRDHDQFRPHSPPLDLMPSPFGIKHTGSL